MKDVIISLTRHELYVLCKLADVKFPYFRFLDYEDKVRAAVEYLVEMEDLKDVYKG